MPDPVFVCIGDKDLPFILQANLIEEVVHTMSVQLFKYIIQQKERREAFIAF